MMAEKPRGFWRPHAMYRDRDRGGTTGLPVGQDDPEYVIGQRFFPRVAHRFRAAIADASTLEDFLNADLRYRTSDPVRPIAMRRAGHGPFRAGPRPGAQVRRSARPPGRPTCSEWRTLLLTRLWLSD